MELSNRMIFFIRVLVFRAYFLNVLQNYKDYFKLQREIMSNFAQRKIPSAERGIADKVF